MLCVLSLIDKLNLITLKFFALLCYDLHLLFYLLLADLKILLQNLFLLIQRLNLGLEEVYLVIVVQFHLLEHTLSSRVFVLQVIQVNLLIFDDLLLFLQFILEAFVLLLLPLNFGKQLLVTGIQSLVSDFQLLYLLNVGVFLT